MIRFYVRVPWFLFLPVLLLRIAVSAVFWVGVLLYWLVSTPVKALVWRHRRRVLAEIEETNASFAVLRDISEAQQAAYVGSHRASQARAS